MICIQEGWAFAKIMASGFVPLLRTEGGLWRSQVDRFGLKRKASGLCPSINAITPYIDHAGAKILPLKRKLQMRIASAMLVLFFLACGDDDQIVQRVRPPDARPPAAASLAERSGTVHEVQMVGSIAIGFRFEPADLTIKVGDTVRWINGSGFPHNVAFYADRIPRGAMGVIESVMPAEGKLGSMIGRIVSELGDVFEMDFVNAPLGEYHYFCVVQEAIGMVGTLIIEQ